MSNERTVVFHLPTMVAGSLAAISGTVAGRTFPLTAGTFVIGRQADLDLPLPVEPGVSKVHAKIVAEGDHYMLYDAESRNGTVVNGRPVQRVRLYDGDEIQVCGCTLRFTQTAGGGVQVKNPPSVDERITVGDLPTRGMSEASLSRRDTGAVALDISTSGLGSATGTPLSPAATEAFPPRQTPSSMEPTYVSPPPQAVARRSPAPWFIIGMLVSMLGGGGVYAMYLMNDGGGARVAVVDDGTPIGTAPVDGAATDPNAVAADPASANGTVGGAAPGTVPTAPADGVVPAAGDPQAAPGSEQPAANSPASDVAVDQAGAAAGDVAAAGTESGPPVAADTHAEEIIAESSVDDPVAVRPKAGRKKDRPKPVEKPVSEAPVEEAEDPAAVVASTTSEPPAAGAEVVTPPEPGTSATTAAAMPAAVAPALNFYPVQVVPSAKAPVRVSSGGRVRSVDAAEGDLVVEGDTLVTFDQAVDAADIATLKESIRALEAVVESGGSSEAEVMLKQEQERLSRLEAGAQQGRVSAPASGTLVGFTPKVGEKLRARQVIGNVVGANSKSVTATVDKADGAKLKKGSKVRVRSASRGEVDGTVTSTKKKGVKFVITIDLADGDAMDVDAVRIP
jgi:hypothetical protein